MTPDELLAKRARIAAGITWRVEGTEDQEPEVRRILRECAARIEQQAKDLETRASWIENLHSVAYGPKHAHAECSPIFLKTPEGRASCASGRVLELRLRDEAGAAMSAELEALRRFREAALDVMGRATGVMYGSEEWRANAEALVDGRWDPIVGYESGTRVPRARLDAEGTAEGKTQLRGVVREGGCLEGTLSASPGVLHVDLETGARTELGTRVPNACRQLIALAPGEDPGPPDAILGAAPPGRRWEGWEERRTRLLGKPDPG